MVLDPRTPVLVGAAAVSQRLDDPSEARGAVDLMALACQSAAADAGAPALLARAGEILVPKGTAKLHSPARALAAALNSAARAVDAELGILQTTLLRRAADDIATGRAEVAVVAGGEAKWRALRASILGVDVPPDGAGRPAEDPDERMAPAGPIFSAAEVRAGLVSAVSQYAILENARRYSLGRPVSDHAVAVAELWSRFNAVAQTNPRAWNRAPMTADEIRLPGPRNRPLAFPYNKWHNSQWNVDQAASLILCSVETAQSLGIPRDRWVFPHAIVDSEHMLPLSERVVLDRSPGFEIAGRRAFRLAGVGVDDIAHVDLYSCFPVAVELQAAAMRIPLDRALTVTGGMTFGGGPLNNYVLQSTAEMVRVLREDAGAVGLVTAISGVVTKQGVSLWSTEPPRGGYRSEDVSEAVAAVSPAVGLVDATDGDATCVGYTVQYDDGAPSRAVMVGDHEAGGRIIATNRDPKVLDAVMDEEWCGRVLVVRDDATFDLG